MKKGENMKKTVLHYQCINCGEKFRFEKSDLPTGFISSDDLNENKINLLKVECPECNLSDVFTLEDIKKALSNPQTVNHFHLGFSAFWFTV